MGALENRIPPPLVATLIGILMGVSARYLPGFELTLGWRLAAGLPVLLLGLGVCLAGVFRPGLQYTRSPCAGLGNPLGEQLVQGGHVILLRFNRTHGGIIDSRQQGSPSVRAAPYGQSHLIDGVLV